mgnify:CR=1 FL=1
MKSLKAIFSMEASEWDPSSFSLSYASLETSSLNFEEKKLCDMIDNALQPT